jgi:hypothetical protein
VWKEVVFSVEKRLLFATLGCDGTINPFCFFNFIKFRHSMLPIVGSNTNPVVFCISSSELIESGEKSDMRDPRVISSRAFSSYISTGVIITSFSWKWKEKLNFYWEKNLFYRAMLMWGHIRISPFSPKINLNRK